MNGHKDSGTVAAEIRMSRAACEGTVLVVEGADDVRFWLPRRHEDCELIDAEGKTNVLGAIKRLAQTHLVGVLGIVDDDYDSLESRKHGSNVVTTDAHDLEGVLCHSSAGTRDIVRVLRVAIPDQELKATGFGKRIHDWENRNQPYAVFAV